MRKLIFVALLLAVVGCGKNADFYGVPNGYQQPPLPPMGYMPPRNYPMPPQMPQQFAPVYGYLNQNGYQPYWNNMWQNWQQYAPQHGMYVYSWPDFWDNYCQSNYPQFYDSIQITISGW